MANAENLLACLRNHGIGRFRYPPNNVVLATKLSQEGEQPALRKRRLAFFAVSTIAGREKSVVEEIARRARAQNLPIASVFFVRDIRGYVFVEAPSPHYVDQVVYRVRHVRRRIRGLIDIDYVTKLVVPRKEEIRAGDIVEICSGVFEGMRGRVRSVFVDKGEIEVELLDVEHPLPVRIRASNVRVVERGEAAR